MGYKRERPSEPASVPSRYPRGFWNDMANLLRTKKRHLKLNMYKSLNEDEQNDAVDVSNNDVLEVIVE